MSPIRALIVEDEPLARELLATMLAAHPEIELVGECGDADSAEAAIRHERPDLVLLDIQMPGDDGFELLRRVGPEAIPVVIFVTAHDTFAIQAFEVHAVDYLLKPFDEARLAAAIGRVGGRLRTRDLAGEAERRSQLIEAIREHERVRDRLVIRDGDRRYFVPLDAVDWIEADGKHARVHAGARIHPLRETLQQVESGLSTERFVRVSRSAIVNLARIDEIRRWSRGEWLVVLKSGAQLATTRSYRVQVERLLSG